MEPILSKQEIADLLAAIRAGKVSLDLGDDRGAKAFLECEPLNLFEMAQRKEDQVRIPNFDIILDNFCRNYAVSLTNHLQRTFTIDRISMEACEYQEYLAKRKNPGSIGLLSLSPLPYSSKIIFDHQLSYSMIEVMLGASSELDPLHLERPLTTIELSIIKTVMSDACHDINKAFAPLIKLNSNLAKVENNPRLASITDPESEVMVGTFHVRVDDLSGEIDLVIPAMTLDPLREKLRELLMLDVSTRDAWKETLQSELQSTIVDIIARSGTITLTVDSILRLKTGNIIPLDYDPNSPLKVLVENQPKFNAMPGTVNGKKAISITGIHEEGR